MPMIDSTTRPLRTVLVANRGEIACRVIRTLRAMGIRSVAVYSDADAGARHVREADVAVRIGVAAAAKSYLDIDAVLDAARSTGAQAIHPGYGFLSENPDFARACERAGIVFIGPGADAIEIMGDKVRAKRLVASRGVPVTPGVDDRTLDDDGLTAAAERLGFPLLIKPSAGGGGMGMVEVNGSDELPAALRTARRVARAAFGDDALFLERLITTPRHLEVQVLADAHGTVVHLGERECSLQRRHQKVVEECPSPAVDAALRARLGEAACEVARAVGYVGVGTVEFIVSADQLDRSRSGGEAEPDFSFMEMNTRLQVEHPVTELVTGIDLVEQQLLVAAGEPLAFGQDDIALNGHAVEARVYAEDASRGFLPATGRVLALHEPTGNGLRVDSALASGLEVTDAYDPMLAKVIAHAPDRDAAMERLSHALRDTTVLGVATNVAFLAALVDDADVRAGRLDTGLIGRFLESRDTAIGDTATGVPDEVLFAAALLAHDDAWRSGTDAPWSRPTGWRLGAAAPARYRFALAESTDADREAIEVAVLGPPERAALSLHDDATHAATLLERHGDRMLVQLDDVARAFRVARLADTLWVAAEHADGSTHELRMLPLVRGAAARGAGARTSAGASDPRLLAPMPGTVVAVEAADGDAVEVGADILVIEAMKMEHRLRAPHAGIVRISVAVGDRVATGQQVAVIGVDAATARPPTEG